MNHCRKTPVGGAVHHGLAIAVHRVDVRTELQQQLGRLVGLLLRAGLLQRCRRAKARGRHQRCRALHVRQPRIGAELQQGLHQRHVRLVGREQERRRSLDIDLRRYRLAVRQPAIDIRSHGDQGPHELQARQVSGALRRRVAAVVAILGLAHPSDGVQRGVAGTLVIRIRASLQ